MTIALIILALIAYFAIGIAMMIASAATFSTRLSFLQQIFIFPTSLVLGSIKKISSAFKRKA